MALLLRLFVESFFFVEPLVRCFVFSLTIGQFPFIFFSRFSAVFGRSLHDDYSALDAH